MRFTNRSESGEHGESPPDLGPLLAAAASSARSPAALPWHRQPKVTSSVVIVPGLRNSGPAHWQSHWHARLPGARRVVLRDWDAPDLDVWAGAVASALASIERPIVVAHSFGCFAALAAASAGARIGAALLVAPADLGRFDVDARVPRQPLAFRSTLVASTNDPWLKLLRAGELASVWGSRFVPYRDAGHINAESGFGPWPEGLDLLEELAHSLDSDAVSRFAS